MPAEKLTKKRLIQIIIMFVILLVAFGYKTYQYYQ
ncbi:hypothetical protein O1Q79_00806 [Lonepinella sp. MS14434]|uniref:Uncharacterized protein n=1 Tax=Lonepinella koalarum TaxID=53417 RepID=A0A4R1KT39_9PAST|nr:hypothetical protein EV692_1946 [Lonepinella koalarum]